MLFFAASAAQQSGRCNVFVNACKRKQRIHAVARILSVVRQTDQTIQRFRLCVLRSEALSLSVSTRVHVRVGADLCVAEHCNRVAFDDVCELIERPRVQRTVCTFSACVSNIALIVRSAAKRGSALLTVQRQN